jgi:hypothetical protein
VEEKGHLEEALYVNGRTMLKMILNKLFGRA